MSTLIIPAAGLATRLRPISNNTSKCMVPVNGKPIISYILDRVHHLFDQIVIVYGKNDDVVRFCKNKYSHLNIQFACQTIAEGPLHAVWHAFEKCKIDNEPLTIWLGDTIVTDYLPSGATEVVAHRVHDWSRWCMISRQGVMYDKPVERPDTNLALVGIYTFDNFSAAVRIVIDIVFRGDKVRGEFQISQLIGLYGSGDIIETEEWFDCGDLPSLYDSSARLLQKFACRPDSSVHVDVAKGTFSKRGDRCLNEAFWYKQIPDSAKPFTPTVYSFEDNGYTMELLSGNTVADFFLYEDLAEDNIRYIIRRCLDSYKIAFMNEEPAEFNSQTMFFKKNVNRVLLYSYEFTKPEDCIKYANFVEEVNNSRTFLDFQGEVSCIHGDFHLGNIMFSPENGRVKFIDPRGKWDSIKTVHGNIYYDFTKFAQSIFGEYIWIYAGVETNHKVKTIALNEMTKWFDDNEIDYTSIYMMVPVLMGAVLEFHTDSTDRQKRIWEKTMTLIKEFNEGSYILN